MGSGAERKGGARGREARVWEREAPRRGRGRGAKPTGLGIGGCEVGTRAAVLYSRADGGGTKRSGNGETCQGGMVWSRGR
jgi:hypothetical protein